MCITTEKKSRNSWFVFLTRLNKRPNDFAIMCHYSMCCSTDTLNWNVFFCVIPIQRDNTCPIRAQYICTHAWCPCVQWNCFTLPAFSSLNVHFQQAIPALTCLIVSHLSTYQLAFAFQNVKFLSSAIWLCINLFRIIIMLHEFSISLMTARHLSPRAAKQPQTTWIIV